MSINDKIKQILIDKNLTPSYFADEIGVQRSSISHILSGRKGIGHFRSSDLPLENHKRSGGRPARVRKK